nr:DUF2268 domain-containing protein [Gemmatimonadaceae bacterium]MCU0650252.1 DUF2268 domain-containing protein [Gemmatimonadaceae bacterium]
MLVNLIPDFLAVLEAPDRVAGPHFEDVVRSTVDADRADLLALLARTDVLALAERTLAQVRDLLALDVDVDVILMVGVGAANAGELVVDGRGVAFVCLEHFTGVANPDTQGLGLDPELLPLWLAHEITHAVRYTSPLSRSEMRALVSEQGLASLREHLVNEGLAVQVSRAISPGHAAWEYLGFARKQYARVRELEPLITRAIETDLDRAGLGLRLRWLSGGMSDEARTVERTVVPERAGYFIGARLVESAIAAHGFAWAVRATAYELS